MSTFFPSAWLAELDDRFSLIADPDGRVEVLSEMAYAARRRHEVDDTMLCEMLELVDAAKLWALTEYDEWPAIGLFDIQQRAEPGTQTVAT